MNRTLLLIAILFFSYNSMAQDTTGSVSKSFNKVEIEAEFPGGQQGWVKFLMKNLNPDVPVNNDAPSGKYTVTARFIVDKSGQVRGAECETSFGFGMENEILRMLKISPSWIPAMQDGRAVNAYRRQPITFIVQEDGFNIQTSKPYVLYENIKNSISVAVRKVKAENLRVTVSRGTITDDGGNRYTIIVKGKERVIISLFDEKKDKLIGQASYEVL
ncbi:MAG: hypothetical protein ABIT96_09440 [Ferruginibacter sp.]